jgi:hypothetical protein
MFFKIFLLWVIRVFPVVDSFHTKSRGLTAPASLLISFGKKVNERVLFFGKVFSLGVIWF